ncbi:biliverdin-producing heme oxygenase [Stenotrophomonas sp. PS02298]|uniref:biliverdin-producing heme oxygenase n=1 Tax=Stenotrophomonas sp. PS02298 TaxID=2991424 RepID=UPI00249CC34F|nr:biliverdin-producing heme oxygenase [Stenotrophomonas sp. PS02298]
MSASPMLLELSRSQRLKAATHGTHERLDQRIMRGEPFASLENYRRFLRVQYRFHRDLAVLYSLSSLQGLLPDLAERQRLQQLQQDLLDLGEALPADDHAALSSDIDPATALGWLYVVEGSNLGAAILFKLAAKIGLDANHGARHLAGHPDGRARHWRRFTEALDGNALDAEQEQRMVAGATAAFQRVHGYVEQAFAD